MAANLRPVGAGPGDWCRGAPVEIDPPVTARFSASSNLQEAGLHEVTVMPSSDVLIRVSKNWGGGTIRVPRRLIKGSVIVEQRTSKSLAVEGKMPIKLHIVAIKGAVGSFLYPKKVTTGLNFFEIVKEKASIELSGARGKVTFRGQLNASLSNNLFSSRTPALAKATFEGSYDHETRQGILAKIEVKAHSPKTFRRKTA